MAQPAILAAILLSGVTAAPSSRRVQWSEDGQLVIIARNSIYILTPQLGVNVQPSTLTKQVSDKDSRSDTRRPVQWLQTMIEWDKDCAIRQWPADCQDWGAVSLGSLDPHFRSATCSPSNLTADAGCVIAVLNSNMQVSLWIAQQNHLTGIWSKVGEYKPSDIIVVPQNGTDIGVFSSLQAQVTSIAWSTQANFATSVTPYIDGSLLALGSRAGTVCLARYSGRSEGENCLQHTASFSVGDRWVTYLAWSQWRSQGQQYEAYLACGISDGSISVVQVSQTLHEVPEHFGFIKDYESFVAYDVRTDKPCEASSKGITSLQWIQTAHPNPFLVFSTPGQLHIWSSAQDSSDWRGHREINLRTVNMTIGSTSVAPLVGVSYGRHEDNLVITLADGSFHVIAQFSTNPTLQAADGDDNLTAEALSAASRSAYLKVEERQLNRTDVNRIGGMVPFDNCATYAWFHESSRPTSFDYKHDARHTSTLVVARLWQDSPDEEVQNFLSQLATVKSATGIAPVFFLRPIFLYLSEAAIITRLHARISDTLRTLIALPSKSSKPALWSGELNPQVRSAYRKSVEAHLFNSDGLWAKQISVSLAQFCQDHSEVSVEKAEYRDILRSISHAIGVKVSQILLQHVAAVLSIITDIEVPFILRIVAQALLPGTPADLGLEARELAAKLKRDVAADDDLSSLGLQELCPACQTVVPFQNTLSGICMNGHTWARCSITSFLLTTPKVRTCIGCARKAFLPPRREPSGAYWLPTHARNWLAEDLLDAVNRCLYCGNRFVTLL